MNRQTTVLREVSWMFLVGLAVLAASHLFGWVGRWGTELGSALVVAWFFIMPFVLLHRHRLAPEAWGLSSHPFGRSLRTSLVTMLIVYPLFAIGYGVWSHVALEAPISLPNHPLSWFSNDLHKRPSPLPEDALTAFIEGETLYVLNPSPSPIELELFGCTCPMTPLQINKGRILLRGGSTCSTHKELQPGQGLLCSINETPHIRIATTPPMAIRTGTLATPTHDTSFLRSPWEIWKLLFLQLLGVALPEEVFYRGYIQSRLAPLFTRRVRLLGVSFGGHIILASLLFALSHLVLTPNPARLLVFFPGLLFGYLREKTGSVVAPVIVHGCSNVLLELLLRCHG